MNPGIYPNIPEAEYRAWPYLSQSTLKQGRKSMLHLRHAMDTDTEPTRAMVLGSALHTAFLEPEQMLDAVAVWTERRVGSEWKAFEADNAHKHILYPDDYEALQGMVRALRTHPEVRRWLSKIEGVEVSAVGDVHGVRMKGRCDALTSDPILDLKKVSANSFDPHDFQRQAYRLGYHIQAHVYRLMFDRDRFGFITVEDNPPHDVVVYELTPEFLRVGEQETIALLQRYQHCAEAGRWPGISDEVLGLDAPAWVQAGEELTLTLDGEEVTL